MIAQPVDIDADGIFSSYLTRLSSTFASGRPETIESLLLPNGYLRDLLITEWDFNSLPRRDVTDFYQEHDVPSIANVRIDHRRSKPVFDSEFQWVYGFFSFETPIAFGHGIAQLQQDPDEHETWNARTLAFALDSYKDFPERTRRTMGGPDFTRTSVSWQERREAEASFVGEEGPQVLIVGAGHNGIMLAARLKRLGVKALIVDKQQRLGDSWRNRYHTLALRDLLWAVTFPYLSFPDDWPAVVPKDMLANWIEAYAGLMELNVWLSSEIVADSTSYDGATGQWTTSVKQKDGTIRQLKTNHIVQCTGGEPRIPNFPGASDFKGDLIHSSQYRNPKKWAGKRAIVVGCNNSAHDIAGELYDAGCEVTMVQRSSTLVISMATGVPISVRYYSTYSPLNPSLEQGDLEMAALPVRMLEPYLVEDHKRISEADREMLDGLAKAGFKVSGEGSAGWLMKNWAHGGGYHSNVGGAQLIIDGKVKVKQGQEIARLEEDGVRFADDSFIGADVVVLATGYQSMVTSCRRIFGDKVADRVGSIWPGLDEQGELKGLWRRCGHPGYWFTAGALVLARTYSKYLALQIKAIEEGLMPKELPFDDVPRAAANDSIAV